MKREKNYIDKFYRNKTNLGFDCDILFTELVGAQWDPMSNSQSVALVNVVTKLLQDYPTLGPSSKAFTLLINNIANKMREAVDNDVFIPIYPRA